MASVARSARLTPTPRLFCSCHFVGTFGRADHRRQNATPIAILFLPTGDICGYADDNGRAHAPSFASLQYRPPPYYIELMRSVIFTCRTTEQPASRHALSRAESLAKYTWAMGDAYTQKARNIIDRGISRAVIG